MSRTIKNTLRGIAVSIPPICFLLFCTTLFSCEEHEDEFDHSISHRVYVGDILLEDCRVVSHFFCDSLKDKAAGVVFYVNQDTAWVVSTKELGDFSYADSLATIGSIESDIQSMCGVENTAALLLSEVSTPAAEAVASFHSTLSSWALPSCGELKKLSEHLPTVSSSMQRIGGDEFSDCQYLSSTQDGSSSESEQMYYLSVTLRNGFITSTIKSKPGRVRPILRIR